MNMKHTGSSLNDAVKRWEAKDPNFRPLVEEYKEKAKMAALLRDVRKQESLTQTALAFRAGIPQSVIARIEAVSFSTLPRLDLYNRILNAAGYRIEMTAKKGRKQIHIAL